MAIEVLNPTPAATRPSSATCGREASIDGDAQALDDLVELLDEFEFWFNIVTP